MYTKLIKEIKIIKEVVLDKGAPNEYYDVEMLREIIVSLSEEDVILLDSNGIYDKIRELLRYMQKLNETIKNPYSPVENTEYGIIKDCKDDIKRKFNFDDIISKIEKIN